MGELGGRLRLPPRGMFLVGFVDICEDVDGFLPSVSDLLGEMTDVRKYTHTKLNPKQLREAVVSQFALYGTLQETVHDGNWLLVKCVQYIYI